MNEVKPFTMALSYNNGAEKWTFPVLPEEITIKNAGTGKGYKIVGKGNISTIDSPELAEISIESHFPVQNAPYLSEEYRTLGEDLKPSGFVKDILRWMSSKHPIRFSYVGRDPKDEEGKIFMAVSIDNFTYWEKAGSPGDVFFKLDLKEYVFHTAKKIKVVENPDGSKRLVAEPPQRPDFRVPPTTYTIQPGDNMVRISAKLYNGDSSRWRELQKLNNIKTCDLRKLQVGRVLQVMPPKG